LALACASGRRWPSLALRAGVGPRLRFGQALALACASGRRWPRLRFRAGVGPRLRFGQALALACASGWCGAERQHIQPIYFPCSKKRSRTSALQTGQMSPGFRAGGGLLPWAGLLAARGGAARLTGKNSARVTRCQPDRGWVWACGEASRLCLLFMGLSGAAKLT